MQNYYELENMFVQVFAAIPIGLVVDISGNIAVIVKLGCDLVVCIFHYA